MIEAAVAAILAIVAVVVEIVLPGQPVYHAGWYNVALCALLVVAVAAGRRAVKRTRHARARVATIAIVAGAVVAGFAGIVHGLFAPDDQMAIGAPGARIRVEGLGVFAFPYAQAGTQTTTVSLERSAGSVAIGERRRDVGNFILRTFQRDVAFVEARDARGSRLTITQPTGTVFLSPVLMMVHRQTIAGINLPYDSFNVPAARRVVKAVLFNAAQSAMLRGGAIGEPAVLFAVDDENERPLAHAIGLSAGGNAVIAGGLSLRATVASYPGVEILAAPNLFATAIGALLVGGGLVTLVASRRALLAGDDRPHVSQDEAALGELEPSGGQNVDRG
ncbi:MAG TPA: hypothetical protein VMU38_05655 [Candidatus Binatia bacterium]|nr:hypothetical protein [Candidatus Binatia bacterium]